MTTVPLPNPTPAVDEPEAVAAPALPALPPSVSSLPAVPDETDLPVVRPADLIEPIRVGVTTSEFWLCACASVALVATAIVLLVADRITQSAFLTLALAGAVAMPTVYATLRTIAKTSQRAVDEKLTEHEAVLARVLGDHRAL